MLKNGKLYAVLALALALTMVFTMTAMAGMSTTIDISNSGQGAETLNWPTEVCLVTVSGLTAGENATIVVYDGSVDSLSSLSSGDIYYIKQAEANSSGEVAFTFMLKDGDYSAKAVRTGGSGNIQVAVGSDNATYGGKVRYTVATLLFPKQVTSIDVPDTVGVIQVNGTQTSLPGNVTVTYNNDPNDTATIALNDSTAVQIADFSTGVANPNPDLSLTASLNLENGETLPSDTFTVGVVTDKNNYSTVTFNDTNDGTTLYTKYVDNNYALALPPLPNSYTSGDVTYRCVGWTTNSGGLYHPDGAPVTITADTTFYGVWVNLTVDAGVSLRLDPKDTVEASLPTSGIRWTTSIDTDLYNNLITCAGESNISVGCVVTPRNYLTNYDLYDTEDSFTIDNLNNSTELKDAGKTTPYVKIISRRNVGNNLIRKFSIAQVKLGSYTRVTSGRSFIEITYTNNKNDIFYSEYNTDNQSRSAKQIADGLIDTAYYNGLGDVSKGIVDKYATVTVN